MTRKTLPPLNALRAFESAARLGSFVAAAEELHVTQPAIGRHVKALEDNLGTQLFQRTPRGVLLTDKGHRYFDQVSAALQSIAEASVDLRTSARKPTLRLVVVPGLASRWLRPRLGRFRKIHPEIRIAVELNASFTDPRLHKADIGIGYGISQDYVGVVSELVRPPIFPVCSPAFLESCPLPVRRAADLVRLPLLHEDDGSWWSDWLRACGVRAKPNAELAYDSADQVLALALAGEGVALSNGLLAAEELADGRLVRPVPQECALEPYVLVRPEVVAASSVRAFEQWLVAELGSAVGP